MERPHWRKMSWVLIGWTTACAIWLISGIASVANSNACTGQLDPSTCHAATQIGAGIGAAMIIGVWFVFFIPLSLVWFMTRKS